MKLNEIPMLDCREKENVKFLIEKFNEMKMIKNKNLSYRNFKNDFDKFAELSYKICSKTDLDITTIMYFKNRQVCHLIKKGMGSKQKKEGKDIYTFVSLNLNEMYLKIIVFCYYKIMHDKKKKVK